MDEKYYLAVLTIDTRKKFFKNRDSQNIKNNILHWTRNLKIKDIILDGPFYDIGEKDNHHANISLKSYLTKEELLNGPFKGWKNNKGYIFIDQIKNIHDWIQYSKRNNYKKDFNKFTHIDKILYEKRNASLSIVVPPSLQQD